MRFSLAIRRMVHTIVSHHITNIERVHSFQTTNIEPIFIWARATLMVGIDTTVRTEVVLRGVGIELI
jgi:hypothetical protein